MRVLHVVAGDMAGGANRGAANLNDLMVEQGIDSEILNLRALSTWGARALALGQRRTNHYLSQALRSRDFFNLFFPFPSPQVAARHFDIINLHWCAGHIAPSFFARYADKLVVTLRDEWMFTGGCHYAQSCAGFEEGCFSCPIVAPGARKMVSQSAELKRRAFAKLQRPIIAIGESLARKARKSFVMAEREVVAIPNYVPPLTSSGVNPDENAHDYFLFVATHLDVPHKGADLLESIEAPLFMVGAQGGLSQQRFKPGARFLGPVSDRAQLAKLIAGARALLVPSRAEAFGKVVLEAFSVGTPVIAHAVDELALLVESGRNGALVEAPTAAAFADAVRQFQGLSDEEYLSFRGCARARYEELMDPGRIVDQYLEVYRRGRPGQAATSVASSSR